MAKKEERGAGVYIAGAAGAAAAAGGTALYIADRRVRAEARRRLGDVAAGGRGLAKSSHSEIRAAQGRNLDARDAANVRKFLDYGLHQANRWMRSGSVTRRVDNPNDKLYGLQEVKDPANRAWMERKIWRVADAVDRATRQTSLPQNSLVFRATGTKSIGHEGGLKPGAVFTDRAVGFAATNVDKTYGYYDSAKARGSNPSILVIKGDGQRGLLADKHSTWNLKGEVLLPSNTQYRVDRVEKGVKRHLFDRPRDYAFVSTATQAPAYKEPPTASNPKLAKPAPASAAMPSKLTASNALSTASAIANRTLGVAGVAAPFVSAANAYGATGSGADAGKAFGQTAAVSASVGLAFRGLARVAPRAAAVLGPAGLVVGAGLAAYGAKKGYDAARDSGASGLGRALGAAKGAIGLTVAGKDEKLHRSTFTRADGTPGKELTEAQQKRYIAMRKNGTGAG